MFLNILLGGVEILLLICLLCFLIYVLVIIPLYGYLEDRLEHNECGDGFVGLLTIIPKFLCLINLLYILCTVSKIVNIRHPNFFPPEFIELLSQMGLIDYLIWGIVFISMIISIEVIRFIEYKVYYKMEETVIYPDKSDIYDEENYFIYNKKRVDIKFSNGNNVISLKLKPTLHGQDSIYGKSVEFIIKEVTKNYEGNYRLRILPKNPPKYSFIEV